MLLRYINSEGKQVEFELGTKTIQIGRSEEADIALADEKASRIHCEIRLWDGDYVVKDLKSRNGTFVNERRVDVSPLQIGDSLRVGGTIFHGEKKSQKGAKTILREVTQEMEEKSKGYRTMLREIVKSAEDKPRPKKG